MSASTRGFEATTYVDASAFVNVTDRLQLSVNAINLTNEKETQFWGQNRYLYTRPRVAELYGRAQLQVLKIISSPFRLWVEGGFPLRD